MAQIRIVIAPDSFKGSLSADAVAESLADGLADGMAGPDIELVTTRAPMADGGEGLLAAVAATCPGQWQEAVQTGIHARSLTARWYVMDSGPAIIESAEVLGLPLIEVTPDAPPLAQRGSYALGTLIAEALDHGSRDIAVGLGGSACNDAGLGLLLALGARAFDDEGRPVSPDMNGLLSLARLDLSDLDARLRDTRLRALCDVDNPLLGEHGASRVYGPQKGLSEADIDAVEAAFDILAIQARATDAAERPGSGAAGGLGFALAVLGAALESGADSVIALTDLAPTMQDADLVITGEGRSDTQTLSGKLPVAIARAARPTPTWLVAGDIEAAADDRLAEYFPRRYRLLDVADSKEAALAEPARYLHAVGREIAIELRRG